MWAALDLDWDGVADIRLWNERFNWRGDSIDGGVIHRSWRWQFSRSGGKKWALMMLLDALGVDIDWRIWLALFRLTIDDVYWVVAGDVTMSFAAHVSIGQWRVRFYANLSFFISRVNFVLRSDAGFHFGFVRGPVDPPPPPCLHLLSFHPNKSTTEKKKKRSNEINSPSSRGCFYWHEARTHENWFHPMSWRHINWYWPGRIAGLNINEGQQNK